MEVEVGQSPTVYANAAGLSRVFEAPAGMSIAGYRLSVAESFTYGSEAGIVGQAYVASSDQSAGNYAYRNLGAGFLGSRIVEHSASEPARWVEARASCDGEGGPCPAHTRIALLAISAAEVTLNDESSPQVSDVQGSLLAGGALHGQTEVSFTASEADGGPGIYSAWFVVDGQPQTPVLLDARDGSCADHGQTSNGTRSFLSPTPCEQTLSSSISLNTAAFGDGQHTLSVIVDDAAGNSAVVYSGTISTDNAPSVLAEPAISGSAQVGSTLTASAGRFAAVQGAGALSAITGQWLRCSDKTATHCAVIAGATSTTYSPVSADVGYYLIYQNTASDNDGATVSDSQPTLAVTEAANTVAGYGSQSNPLSSVAGGAGGGGAGGGAGGPGGSGLDGLTINLPGSSNGPLGSQTPWAIILKARPMTVRRGEKLVFTGRISTGLRPPAGNKIYLRARALKSKGRGHHKHTIYGSWVTFATTKANSRGEYKAEHKMKFGGSYTYQFIALAPQETGYRNTQGVSAVVTVHEKPR